MLNRTLSLLLLAAISCNNDPDEPSPPATTPAPPTDFSASAGDAEVTLSWSPVATALSYTLYWSTEPDVSRADTAIADAISPYVHRDLENGRTYYYRIAAVVNELGDETELSEEISVVPRPAAAVPPAPSNLVATAGDGLVALTWDDTPGALSYNIYHSEAPGTDTSDTSSTDVASGYAVSPLINGTAYYFVVTAHNATGEGPASTEVAATPVVSDPIPAAPTNLRAVSGNGAVTLTWDVVNGATSYHIYWSATSGTGTAGTRVTDASSGQSVTGLANGTPYFFVVTAENAAGESAASTETSAVPSDPDTSTMSTDGGTVVTVIETATVDSPTGFDPDLTASLDLTAAWGGAPQPATSVRVQSGYAGDAWSEVLTFDIYGVTTGTFTIADHDLRARYVSNGTTFISDDGTITSGTVTVTAVDDIGGKIAGSYNLLLCLDVNCPGGTVVLAGTFSITRETDAGTFDNPSVLSPAVGQVRRVDDSVNSSYFQLTPVTPTPTKVYLSKLGDDVDLHLFADASFTSSLCDSTSAGTNVEDCVGTPTSDSLFLAVERIGSGATFELTVVELSSLPAPLQLNAVGGDGEVLVRWDPLDGVSSYTLYWGDAAGATSNTISDVASPFLHTSLVNGTEYFYAVSATVPATGEGPPSLEVSATPGTVQPPVTFIDRPASSVTNALATGCGAEGALARTLNVVQPNDLLDVNVAVNVTHPFVRDVDLFLEYDNGETVVCVELSTGNGGSGNDYANTVFDSEAATAITGASAPFTGSFVPEGDLTRLYGLPMTAAWTLYTSDSYSAGDAGELDTWSLDIAYAGSPPPPPPAPASLAAQAGDSSVTLAWDPVTEASSYTLYWSDSPGVTTSSPDRVDSVSSPFTHTGRTNETTYHYIVTAWSAGGESAPSSEASGTPEEATEGAFIDPVGGLEIPYISDDATACAAPGAMARTITTSRTDAIHDVFVGIEITHPYADDVEIFLEFDNHGSPICIELTSDNGGSGDDFVGTIFDSQATESIENGSPPFTGRFRPEDSLADLFNLPMDGTWTLWLSDDDFTDTGYLDAWDLFLKWGDPMPPPQPYGVLATPRNAEISIAWEPMIRADSFNVYWSTTPDIDIGTAAVFADVVNSPFVHDGLTNGTTYYYVVTATNVVGESLPSPEVAAAPFNVLSYSASPSASISDSDSADTCGGASSFTASDITVAEAGTIADIDVEIDISHSYLRDLDIFVELDNGNEIVCVELSTDNGGTSDDYTDTVFDDEASNTIILGSAPFTGRYQPEGNLSDLYGLSMTGTYRLYVSDDEDGITGTLNSWGVIIVYD